MTDLSSLKETTENRGSVVRETIQKYLPYLALAAGIFALSLSAIFVRWAQAPGIVASFYRMLFAAILLLPFFWRYTTVKPAQPVSPKWIIFPILSGLFNSLDLAMWSTALMYTRVANAALLNNISPLWVALFAFFIWKERLNRRFWIGLALTLSGAVIVFGHDVIANPHLSFGDLLGLSSSLFYAGYYLVTQRGRSFYHVLPYIWIVTLTSSVCLLGYIFIIGYPLNGYTSETYLLFLVTALVSQLIGSFSLTYALGRLPATVVAPTMILQPVFSALLAIPAAGEMLMPAQWVGGLAVLCGIYLVNRR